MALAAPRICCLDLDTFFVSVVRLCAIALRTVSLDNADGLAEAHAAGIRTIPTLILGDGNAKSIAVVNRRRSALPASPRVARAA